ncbi:hypothetical protein [Pedobacter mucosus]|uniref:hypothetical protein n=1 Tax=Pedobacter mucosus TaxID=2895286 RepID=UPI001EE3EB1B|nr:hypothetical protein [Pedobacter mucosus]UKT65984.1 hypothetical protein LOK61_09370 [Pedobacter mucosus]
MENINGAEDRWEELTPQGRAEAMALASGYEDNGMNETDVLQKGIAEAEGWFIELDA